MEFEKDRKSNRDAIFELFENLSSHRERLPVSSAFLFVCVRVCVPGHHAAVFFFSPRVAFRPPACPPARLSSSSPGSRLAEQRSLLLSFNIKDVSGVLYSPADVLTPLKLSDSIATEGEISPRAVVANTHTHSHTLARPPARPPACGMTTRMAMGGGTVFQRLHG